jgi:NAD(P)-dependent dehydrogenase (short-subunit alcohol dehydrogenase family)
MSIFRPGSVALITGAASGIGFAVSTHCRRAGMSIHLLDINAAHLSKAKELLTATPYPSSEKPPAISTYAIDVSDTSAWAKLEAEIGEDLQIDFLMLNAGAAFNPEAGKGPWEDPGYFTKTYRTNVFGIVNGLATFLPAVIRGGCEKKKAVILTGSKQGITNPPLGKNPAYNSTKAAVKSMAEHLSFDLHKEHPNVGVHLLIPGWTFTSFSGNSGPVSDEEALKAKPKGSWLPSQVKDYMVKKVDEGKFWIVCPDDDVDEILDRARMEWAMGELVGNKMPLSRWREDGKEEAAGWIEGRVKELRGS